MATKVELIAQQMASGLEIQRVWADLVVNPKDKKFAGGAKGDGVTDDTDALQAAIDTGKNIVLPKGTYKISSTLTIGATQSFVGMSPDVTLLSTGNFVLLSITGGIRIGAGLFGNFILEGAGRQGTAIQLGGVGDPASNTCAGVTFENIIIHNFYYGLDTYDNVYLNSFHKIFFDDCNRCVNLRGYNNAGENMLFTSCAFSNSNEGVYIADSGAGGSTTFFNSCSFDYNDGWSLTNGTTPNSTNIVTVTGCHFETEQDGILNNGLMTIQGTGVGNGANIGVRGYFIANYSYMTITGGRYTGSGPFIYSDGLTNVMGAIFNDANFLTKGTNHNEKSLIHNRLGVAQFQIESAQIQYMFLGSLSNAKKITTDGGPPSTGAHAQGEFVFNTFPAESGSTGSKTVVLGWVCTAFGEPGTWVPIIASTGN